MEGRRIKKETRLNLETSCKPAVPLKLHKNVPLYGLHQALCCYAAITRDIYLYGVFHRFGSPAQKGSLQGLMPACTNRRLSAMRGLVAVFVTAFYLIIHSIRRLFLFVKWI